MQINDNIKKARELNKWSQAEIAVKLGEKRSTYAEWERNTIPKADILQRISELTGVGLDELLDGRTKNVPQRTISGDDQKETDVQPVIQKIDLYERLVAAEGDRRKKAEETAERYLKIIEDNLTALLLSSAKNQEYLVKIYDEQTSDDLVMMNNQDSTAGNPEGTSAGKSGILQVKLATERKGVPQKTEKDTSAKARR